MITPKVPDGADSRWGWMQWATEEIQRLQPMQVRDQRMLTTARGNCDIALPSEAKKPRHLTEYWTLDDAPGPCIGKIQGIALNPVATISEPTALRADDTFRDAANARYGTTWDGLLPLGGSGFAGGPIGPIFYQIHTSIPSYWVCQTPDGFMDATALTDPLNPIGTYTMRFGPGPLPDLTTSSAYSLISASTAGNKTQGYRTHTDPFGRNYQIIGLDTGNVPGLRLRHGLYPHSQGEMGLCFWVRTDAIGDNPILAYASTDVSAPDPSVTGAIQISALLNNPSSIPPNFWQIQSISIIARDAVGPHIPAYSTGHWHMILVTVKRRLGNPLYSIDGGPLTLADTSNLTWFQKAPTGRINILLQSGGVTDIDHSWDEIAFLADNHFTQKDVAFFWNGGAGLTWPDVKRFH